MSQDCPPTMILTKQESWMVQVLVELGGQISGQGLKVLPSARRHWNHEGAGGWAQGNGVCAPAWGAQEWAASFMKGGRAGGNLLSYLHIQGFLGQS